MNAYPINLLLTRLGDHQLSARASDGYTYSLLCETTVSLQNGEYHARIQGEKLFLKGEPEIDCLIIDRLETTLDRPPYLFPKAKQ